MMTNTCPNDGTASARAVAAGAGAIAEFENPALTAGLSAVRSVEVILARLRQDQAAAGGDRVPAPERVVVRSDVDRHDHVRQRRAGEVVHADGARVPPAGILVGPADELHVRRSLPG